MPALSVRVLLILSLVLTSALCPKPSRGAAIEYTVEIPNLPDGITDMLSSVSDCAGLQDNPPDSLPLLRSRMNNDVKAFSQALKSRGYFKSGVAAALDEQTTPPTVRFDVTPGPRFIFAQPRVILNPDNPALSSLLNDILKGLAEGTGYSSGAVVDTEYALLERLREHGRPSPVSEQREVLADHATDTVAVRFVINTGPEAVFGDTDILGLEDVSRDVVFAKLAWQKGSPYDKRLVDKTREQLIRTGLFRSVQVVTDHVPEAHSVAMRITLLEAPPRSVRSGLWFYSDLGFGAGLGWTHRNIFGAGQELRLNSAVSEKLQEAGAGLILPNFNGPGRSLDLSARFENEETDVYDTTNLSLSCIARRPLADLNVGYGLAYRLAEVDDDETRRFNLLSVPLILEYSSADNPLDPTSGLTLAGRVEPFASLEERSSSFVLWSISGRNYLPLLQDRSLILATRGRYALLAGTGRDSIPEDMLLYAGGGGSVRGYAYQYAGLLDEDDEPLGGVSAVDFSAELRWRMSTDFGFVLFGDGGGAFTDRNPSEKEDYFWAAGTGLRYFTPIGPIRADLAIPLDRRDGVDDPFLIYISLGQAF
ncbi:MAG: BamA/TamA family outer membrane protein [Desulfovibrionales bacterium]|nr:BamA/TamA family outer membrane protein [Desulfovibrionales bacterium]